MSSGSLKLAACLVNVSCGRQPAVIEQIAAAALRATSQVHDVTTAASDGLCDVTEARQLMRQYGLRAAATVLSVFSDVDYDRTVITVAAPLPTLGASVVSLCQTACDLIDLTQHSGGHPRLGAVDLVPVHPLSVDTTLEECGELARAIGHRVTSEVAGSAGFWFGAADPQRRSLPARRRLVGWFSGRPVTEQVDLGVCGPRLGVTGYGAIPYMTNYNVTLDTDDLRLGEDIARRIRGRTDGGLPGKTTELFTSL